MIEIVLSSNKEILITPSSVTTINNTTEVTEVTEVTNVTNVNQSVPLTFDVICGEVIPIGKLIFVNNQNLAFIASQNSANPVLGIAIEAGGIGSTIKVQHIGIITVNSNTIGTSLIPGRYYYVGNNGFITLIDPFLTANVNIQLVGIAVNTTQLQLQLSQRILNGN